MTDFVFWYLFALAAGWLAFPLAFRFLPAVPDRGYTSSRALGLVLWGYIFWLLNSLGILHNNTGSLFLAWLILAVVSAWALRGNLDIRRWLRQNYRLVLLTEGVFLAAFAAWAIVRAANPEAVGTEKPMELAFINAILGSPSLPPHDPWLSGYAISYYYFGYVIVAMLAKISGTSGGVAFNLGIAMIFALSACGAYGLVYNLLAALRQRRNLPAPALGIPLLGPLFLLLVSNLEGFLHSLHTRGLFWQRSETGALSSGFWRWLDIKDLNVPPTGEPSWIPTNFWWWWRASRVLQDYDLAGAPREIIDEFPFFSYLLADLHPHVLAMPFGLLAILLALNVLLEGPKEPRKLKFGKPLHIAPFSFLFAALILGGMAFMNTWDFPFYVALFAAAYAVPLALAQKRSLWSALGDFIWMSGWIGITGILLYLPFYLGFSSQAGGILPNLIFPTRGAHLWVMFAPLLVPILAFLVYLLRQQRTQADSRARSTFWEGVKLAFSLILFLFIALLLLSLLIVIGVQIGIRLNLFGATDVAGLLRLLGATDIGSLLSAALLRRLDNPGGWLTMLILFALALAALLHYFKLSHSESHNLIPSVSDQPLPDHSSTDKITSPPSHLFAILLILLGALLVLGPEFFYLRDQFGWRMNTIFKFYYQAWVLWSIAAAYVSAVLLESLRRPWSIVFRLGWGALVAMSLVYPLFSLGNKTNGFTPIQWTLDSSAYLRIDNPDEAAAIDWLRSAPFGVLAEAVPEGGGSYTQFARFATHSGKPGVLGWYGHESQWRGGGELLSPRQRDLEKLYCARDWSETQMILAHYQIRYIIVSPLERSTYHSGGNSCPSGLVESKFARNLKVVFKFGQVTIYEYPVEN